MASIPIHHLAPYEPRLFVGPGPHCVEEIDALRELGVTGLLSLQSDLDLRGRGLDWSMLWQLYTQRGIEARRVPIRDFDRRDLADHVAAGVSALDGLLASHDRVYLHCTAGINRSTTIALAHLYRGLGPDRALAALMECHPHAVPYPDTLVRWWRRQRA